MSPAPLLINGKGGSSGSRLGRQLGAAGYVTVGSAGLPNSSNVNILLAERSYNIALEERQG
jgi:hypothetical protein